MASGVGYFQEECSVHLLFSQHRAGASPEPAFPLLAIAIFSPCLKCGITRFPIFLVTTAILSVYRETFLY